MAVTVTIDGVITITDNLSGSVTSQKKVLGSYSGTVATEGQNVLIGTSPTSITLPGSPTNFVYIKNLSTTNTLTITWTPNGGASNVVITLEPSSLKILNESVTGAGITALSVTASSAATPIEYVLVA
jgi:hypothetical protein